MNSGKKEFRKEGGRDGRNSRRERKKEGMNPRRNEFRKEGIGALICFGRVFMEPRKQLLHNCLACQGRANTVCMPMGQFGAADGSMRTH